jgi:DinB family protein
MTHDASARAHRSGRSGRPAQDEAAPYYFRYIDRIAGDDAVPVLEAQLADLIPRLAAIPDAASTSRYASDKWSMREVLGHVSDTERLFVARAFWFARGFDTPMPSFEPDPCAVAGGAGDLAWDDVVEEFRSVRLATLAFFRNLPPDRWTARGVASGNTFSVRALAFLAAGHADHHAAILAERYGVTRAVREA